MSEKPPEPKPPDISTTSVVEPLSEAEQPAPKPEPAAPKAEPERMPPPLPPRASRPAPAAVHQASHSPLPPYHSASAPAPAPGPAAAPDAAKAWRILSHASTIRGWAIVWLVAMALTVSLRETIFILNRYVYLDISRLHFLLDLLPLTLLLLLIGAFVMRRAARSISLEFSAAERRPESDGARTASGWATTVLAAAAIAMAIRYVTEYSVLSGNIDIFYLDLRYRLETWLHRVLGIFIVVASILLVQRMGPLIARQRALIGAARPSYPPVAAAYAPAGAQIWERNT